MADCSAYPVICCSSVLLLPAKFRDHTARLQPQPSIRAGMVNAARTATLMSATEETTGTTIMAIKYQGGVIIGADTRTSMGTYIPNRITDKLTALSRKIYCCRSGSSADTQMVARHVRNTLKSLEMIEMCEPTVKRAARIARNIVYGNKHLLAGLIVAGYDDASCGSIFNINLGGSMFESEWVVGGSGSAYIYGLCDTLWRRDMTLEDGLEFVKNAVACAIRRDNMSGGCIRMAVINRNGVERYFVPGSQVPA